MNCNINYCKKKLVDCKYRVQKNNTKHLVGLCPIHGWRYLEFRDNLDLPIVFTNLKSRKLRNGERISQGEYINPQPSLL